MKAQAKLQIGNEIVTRPNNVMHNRFNLRQHKSGNKLFCTKCEYDVFVETGESQVACANSKCRQLFSAIGLSS